MAVDFLDAVGAHQYVKEKVKIRRSIVVKFLEGPDTDKPYRLRRNMAANVVEELKKFGIESNSSQVNLDAEVFKISYRYLQGQLDESTQVKMDKWPNFQGVKILKRLGITRWEEVESKIPKNSLDVVPDMRIVTKIEELKQVTTTQTISAPKEQRALSEILASAAKGVYSLEVQRDNLVAESERLSERNHHLEVAVDSHAEDIKFRDEMIFLLEREAKDAKMVQLEILAKDFAEYPQLWNCVQQVKSLRSKNIALQEDIRKSLPDKFAWPNEAGNVEYMGHFMDGLARLNVDERSQTIKSLSILLTRGPMEQTLGTHGILVEKMPHTPRGSMQSRASGSIRFTWKKHQSSVVVYWIYRKGDGRVGYSEK